MLISQKPRLIIHDWALSRRRDYDKPLGFYYHVLIGRCPSHPKFLEMSKEEQLDNPIMTSSKVIQFSFENRIAETQNTIYELGSIDMFWHKYLEAESILLSSLDFGLNEELRVG